MRTRLLNSVLLLLFLAIPCMAQENVKRDFSLRANLLRWATTTPNIGFETTGIKGWNAVVGVSYAHWSWDNKARHYGLLEATVEARHYLDLGERTYLGVQAKVGQFNYKLSATGKQGDIIGGGLAFGHKLPLGQRLALDFSLSAGYLYVIDLESYDVDNGVRVFHGRKRNKGYWGVTDVGVTLSYDL